MTAPTIVRASAEPRLRRRLTGAVSGLALAVGLLAAGPADAETLKDALANAYRTNPNLDAARRELGATNEQVPQAKSGWRPQVSIEGRIGRQYEDQESAGGTGAQQTGLAAGGGTASGSSGGDSETTTPRSVTLRATQPLYRGGSTVAGVDRAENTVKAQRARLISTEQDILFRAAQAYMDVWRDKAVLRLNESNVEVLRRQLQATRDRFEVGEVTRTDVAQAESRLARAIADRTDAQGQLNASRATYKEVIGRVPQEVEQAPVPEGLPANLEAAVSRARADNPDVRAADFSYRARRDETQEVAGELLPSADLVGELRHSEDQFSTDDETQTAEVRFELTIPLYQQGQVFSRVREVKQRANQARLDLRGARNTAEENAVSAWENLQAARAQISSLEEQVRAAEIALDGVRQESQVGARTVLDVLDAEQELLNAQVDLVRAQRDEVVAAYRVLQAVGELNARAIGLDVQLFEPERNYEAVSGKWFGWGLPEEQSGPPEGSSDTPSGGGQ